MNLADSVVHVSIERMTADHPEYSSFTSFGPSPRSDSAMKHRWLLLAGLVVGYGLRLYRLGAESLWYDESVSAFLSRESLPGLIEHTARDIHPPAYYILLYIWEQVSQPELNRGFEFLFAYPSLFWGMLLLPLLYGIAVHLFDRKTAAIALWLAALHPFHVWYSQEVRMYTMAAALGLLCFWIALHWLEQATHDRPSRTRWRWLIAYALFAALGLYTLYYFAFLLCALVLLIFGAAVVHSSAARQRLTMEWLPAQAAVLLLWLPWFPIFWRQATTPPVPPWRGDLSIAAAISEILGALLVGQSPPLQLFWPWAFVLVVLLGALYHYTKYTRPIVILTGYVAVPLIVLLLLSVTVTPLYHIRYAFTYAAAVPVLLAAALLQLMRHRLWWTNIGIVLVITLLSWSLVEFWHNPLYRADDHRTAVADLARQWRPGDAILVNAGWVYPVLDLYWPRKAGSAVDSTPGRQLVRERLLDYTKKTLANAQPAQLSTAAPVLVLQGGSIDGNPDLGWGLPDSDFYALSTQEAKQSLQAVAAAHPVIWQYRLYDTVSDPQATIRRWFERNTEQIHDQPYPGRDYLRLQAFATTAATDSRSCPRQQSEQATFGDDLSLLSWASDQVARAGETIYVTACWRLNREQTDVLRTSLRLYQHKPEQKILVAQHDVTSFGEHALRTASQTQRTALSLPLPASLPPGNYELVLMVYRADDGQPLPIASNSDRISQGQQLILQGSLPVSLPQSPPVTDRPQAVFDYIEFLSGQVSPVTTASAPTVPVSLIWRPKPSEYVDTYRAILSLVRESETTSWQMPLGGPYNPSGIWTPNFPVQQWEQLVLPTNLSPGRYTVTLEVERASDGLSIPARTSRWPWRQMDSVTIGVVELQP